MFPSASFKQDPVADLNLWRFGGSGSDTSNLATESSQAASVGGTAVKWHHA